VAAFPITMAEGIQPKRALGTIPVPQREDVITRPEAVVLLAGKPIGPSGGLAVNPGDLVRTGPHGSLIRADALLSGLRAGLTDGHNIE